MSKDQCNPDEACTGASPLPNLALVTLMHQKNIKMCIDSVRRCLLGMDHCSPSLDTAVGSAHRHWCQERYYCSRWGLEPARCKLKTVKNPPALRTPTMWTTVSRSFHEPAAGQEVLTAEPSHMDYGPAS